ncbi:hydantoinase B/oxoprolinase family protein [Fictibacillus enclensis]|uniref:hydantoinase B/oxoprolinase family protein n=1 Tax=Fictibacillus enclensis TaxID=1017270 RepID=UPI0025A0995C|nr:hydantoinase B/oxoprolinase family protein [Fictibacillus enclensis]MDM5196711.1 hydantoinase B/oxoprolinase family protein [Fictibacillus enclensis]
MLLSLGNGFPNMGISIWEFFCSGWQFHGVVFPEAMEINLANTDPQTGIINAPLISGTSGAVLQAILQLLCNDIPWSVGGIKRVFQVEAKPGTILSAQHPAGASMGATGSAWLAGNCANIAISKLLIGHPEHKERLVAGTAGSWVTVVPMGPDQYGSPFLTMIMDSMAGGFGARSFGDGVDTGGLLCTPSGQYANVESNELFYPILYLYRREKTDSEGGGGYGDPLEREPKKISEDVLEGKVSLPIAQEVLVSYLENLGTLITRQLMNNA